MALHVSIDFGTSSTCAAMALDDQDPQVLVMDGQPLIPSALYTGPDGTLFVGHEAERHAALDPSRFEPTPKRRIDERELLLGSTVLSVVGGIRAVLQRVINEARRAAGGRDVDLLVLTHPAAWGAPRTERLRCAARGLASRITLVPEPVAAALFYRHHYPGAQLNGDATLAVLDVGAGTADATVVAEQGSDFRVLATRGIGDFGGADMDQYLLDYVGTHVVRSDPSAWRKLIAGRELADRRRRRTLEQDIRGAKETLSRHTYTDVPLPPPFTDAHIRRADLEKLIATPLARVVNLLGQLLAASGLTAQQLGAVFLVGGASRIPLLASLVHQRLRILPIGLDQPETVVARGALHLPSCTQKRPVGEQLRILPAIPTQPLGPPLAPESDSLSRASTIVIGGSDPTRRVTQRRRWLQRLVTRRRTGRR